MGYFRNRQSYEAKGDWAPWMCGLVKYHLHGTRLSPPFPLPEDLKHREKGTKMDDSQTQPSPISPPRAHRLTILGADDISGGSV